MSVYESSLTPTVLLRLDEQQPQPWPGLRQPHGHAATLPGAGDLMRKRSAGSEGCRDRTTDPSGSNSGCCEHAVDIWVRRTDGLLGWTSWKGQEDLDLNNLKVLPRIFSSCNLLAFSLSVLLLLLCTFLFSLALLALSLSLMSSFLCFLKKHWATTLARSKYRHLLQLKRDSL